MHELGRDFLVGLSAVAALLLAGPSLAEGGNGIPAVVADFDYRDTSGEPRDQKAQHAERMRVFAGILRERLDAEGGYRVLELDCPEEPCSAGRMNASDLIRSARRSGARLLIYGRVHKISTLIQSGRVQAVDLEGDKLLLDRSFSFRGDTDVAFRRAARFVVRMLQDVEPRGNSD